MFLEEEDHQEFHGGVDVSSGKGNNSASNDNKRTKKKKEPQAMRISIVQPVGE